jgi:hypothetical protein
MGRLDWRHLRSEKGQIGTRVNTLMNLPALESAIDLLLDSDDQVVYLITDAVTFLLIKSVHGNDGINHLKPVVIICTTRFNIKKLYIASTHCIYVFFTDLKTNSDYFPTQH